MNYKELKEYVKASRTTASDETALDAISLYPYWKEGLTVAVGERYQYNNLLYRCIQAHTTQADWMPEVTPALWAKVSLEEWPEWVQPLGSEDAYPKDAKVTHNGIKYISLVDANVWEPGTVGTEALWSEFN